MPVTGVILRRMATRRQGGGHGSHCFCRDVTAHTEWGEDRPPLKRLTTTWQLRGQRGLAWLPCPSHQHWPPTPASGLAEPIQPCCHPPPQVGRSHPAVPTEGFSEGTCSADVGLEVTMMASLMGSGLRLRLSLGNLLHPGSQVVSP